MSLSQPKAINPCKKFIEFKGNTGIFQYWDKEGKENIEVPKPSFIVLDELSTITGYSDAHQCGIYSNEVRNTKNDTLNVRSFKGGMKIVGKYADIKGDIQAAGGKYCKSVYAALIHGDELELVNFRFSGAAFSAWLDFKAIGGAVQVNECADGKKGSVKFKTPIFSHFECKGTLVEKATEMDREFQKFLSQYLESNKPDESVQHDAWEGDNLPGEALPNN